MANLKQRNIYPRYVLSIGSRKAFNNCREFICIYEFDNRGVELILAEGIEEKVGFAIMNRTKKASGFNMIMQNNNNKYSFATLEKRYV